MTTRFADHLLDGNHAGRPAATAVPTGTLYACTDHALIYQSDGATWSTWADLGTSSSSASGQGFKDFDKKKRTSGNINLNAAINTLANVDTTLDITLTAATGDEIEVGIMGLSNQVGEGSIDVATIVGGSPVSYFGGLAAGTGNGPWHWNSSDSMFCGSLMKTLASGDVSSGTVTLRLRYQNWNLTTKQLYATTATPFQWWAKNLGPIPA